MKIETILCPLDFSEFSDRAYVYAHSLAEQYEAKLIALHAIEPIAGLSTGMAPMEMMPQPLLDEVYESQRAAAEKRIAELQKSIEGSKIEPAVQIELGMPADSILLSAKRNGANLIVMGTHGRRGLDRFLVGSTTEKILRRAPCPVLVVHSPKRDFVRPGNVQEPVQLKKLLCCVDFSEHSPRALEYTFSLGLQYDAELVLLHVIEGAEDGEPRKAREEEIISAIWELVPSEVRRWAKIVPVVRAGKAYEEIVEQARQSQSDAVVMGVRGRNLIDLALFGSTTHRVIQLGPCPVFVVRA